MRGWIFGNKQNEDELNDRGEDPHRTPATRAPMGASDGHPGAGPGNMSGQRGDRTNQS